MKDEISFIAYLKIAAIKSFKNKWFIISLILITGLTIYKIIDKGLHGFYLFAAFCIPISLLVNQMNIEMKNDND